MMGRMKEIYTTLLALNKGKDKEGHCHYCRRKYTIDGLKELKLNNIKLNRHDDSIKVYRVCDSCMTFVKTLFTT